MLSKGRVPGKLIAEELKRMAAHETEKIRNVAFVGEGGNGKTSLVEACLFTAGSTDRQGKVDAGSTILDSEPEEVKRCLFQSA